MQAQAKFFDQLYVQAPRRWLLLLLLTYVLLASNYALYTPAWQAPDEPAHYNNIAYIAQNKALPILQMGDYNQSVQSTIISAKFPVGSAIDTFRYEGYQPPLYYLLATPMFWWTNGNLTVLRLFGVLLGTITLLLIYFAVELVFTGKSLIPLGATAFAALLPMHVAMTAALNNDSLAELLVAASLLGLLRWMRPYFYPPLRSDTQPAGRRALIWLGIWLGLGLVTKIYAYVLLPLFALTIVVVIWRRQAGGSLAQGVLLALWSVIPALLLGMPLWIRNWRLYGAWDILGTAWHDQVVAGQPRTYDWIVTHGWIDYSERAVNFTFKSFWGVFGWLAVFMDERIYTAILLFTGILFLGLLWALVRWISGGPDTDMDLFQLWVLGLFAIMILAVLAGYIWYNAKFVQHQGRYFFWGLLPLSTFMALSWREVLRPLQGAITGFLAIILAAAITMAGYVGGSLDKWTILTIGLMAFFLFCQPLLLIGNEQPSNRWLQPAYRLATLPFSRPLLAILRLVAFATPLLLLALLNLLVPVLYLLPQLSR
jgi:hypothetical protein